MSALMEYTALLNTAVQQRSLANEVIEAIINGEVSALQVDTYLKSIENTIAMIRKNKQVKDLTIDEAKEYGKKFQQYGAEITVVTKSNYDYSQDGKWLSLKEQEKEIADQRKAREKFLKAIPLDGEIFDMDTGENCKNPLSSQSEYLTIKFGE